MKWSYGVTAVPERENTLLPRTLESLAKAGFDKPRLFFDGIPSSDYLINNYDLTVREPKIRTWGNWWLAAWELLIRDYTADRYAIFQDDILAVSHLREYLESWYPSSREPGYLNLYTVPQNEQLAPKKSDFKSPSERWFPSNQRGLGALALVFSRDALLTLFKAPHAIERPITADNKRRYAAIDGGIVTSFRKAKWKEYCHFPTLVQHAGTERSTVEPGKVNPPPPKSFPGEDFDARAFLSLREPRDQPEMKPSEPSPKQRTERIGLVGYCSASGLGSFNRQTVEYAEIDRWLIKPHGTLPTLDPGDFADVVVCPNGNTQKLKEFVQSIDTLLFFETPYYPTLISLAKSMRKRIVCVPMIEWLPDKKREWTTDVDLFICPTVQAYEEVKRDGLPTALFPWPVDTNPERFPFRVREYCSRFLFLNGNGGWKGRKGADTIQKALDLWSGFPLTVKSQKSRIKWGNAKVVSPGEDNTGLYEDGDVLVVPHKVDGYGLEVVEAMACGLPVITPDGLPWNEFPSIGKIKADVTKKRIKRVMDWYDCSAESLVEICKSLVGRDIKSHSEFARTWAVANNWESQGAGTIGETAAQNFNNLVRHGA